MFGVPVPTGVGGIVLEPTLGVVDPGLEQLCGPAIRLRPAQVPVRFSRSFRFAELRGDPSGTLEQVAGENGLIVAHCNGLYLLAPRFEIEFGPSIHGSL